MPLFFILGWRNLRRRKWRTLATAAMLFIGSFLLVFMTGIMEGAYGTMIEVGTRIYNGDFQVLHSNYQEKPTLFKSISDFQARGDALRADPRVTGISYRVEAPGLLSYQNQTMGALVIGMEPDHEISSYTKTLSEGAWWQEVGETLPIVIGDGIARRMRIGIGTELTFVGQAADGSIAAELFTVVGLLKTGLEEFDRGFAFIPLQTAQELIVMEGKVHRIVGQVTSKSQLADLIAAHPQALPQRILAWQDLLPELSKTIAADRRGGLIFLFMIIVVVLISVTNTMVMNIMERTFELGVMQALGTSPLLMMLVIFAEMLWLGLLGLTPGVLVGMAVNSWLHVHGISFDLDDLSYGGVKLGVVYPVNTMNGCIWYPLLVLFAMFLAGILPALKAALMNPVDAMRD